MNKVITINLGGNAYQLEEGGYDLLRAYLESAAARLRNNPDRDEILSDIEGAIAEKFRGLLASHKTVVETKEVSKVLAEMGPIDADDEASDPAGPSGAGRTGAGGTGATGPESAGTPKRLYRIYDGAMVSGVCNGIAAYLNVDPTLVRLAFVLLTLFWGMGLLIYVIMAFLVPEARSAEEKAAASGLPATAQEFIRRAKAGYYETMKNLQNPRARHEWRQRFRREMRAHAYPWRHHWNYCWAPRAPIYQPWMGFALPFLSFLNGTATVIWICAMISLLDTGTVFGLPLPANVPPWVAALLLFILYAILTGSLKTARRLLWWSANAGGKAQPGVWLAEAAIWLLMAAILFLLAVHFFPELHTAVQAVPSLIHQAKDDIQAWWKPK
ncbi:MAG TPA: PspC domain-containing protein [Candidatus Acidoferrales bacterium]|nr:PspC domain-containing protein [Candidatus Acidoferrales bacterium]